MAASGEAGGSTLNMTSILAKDIDPNTGFPYSYKFWPTWQEATVNPLTDDWSAHMDDATSTMEYLEANDMITVGAGASYAAPADSSEIETLRNQVKAIIIQYSWQMSFAADEAEFDSLLKEMQEKAVGLGYDQVYEFDLENAKAQTEARVDVVKAFDTEG